MYMHTHAHVSLYMIHVHVHVHLYMTCRSTPKPKLDSTANPEAVDTSVVRNMAISKDKITLSSIDEDRLSDGSVTNAKLADSSTTSNKHTIKRCAGQLPQRRAGFCSGSSSAALASTAVAPGVLLGNFAIALCLIAGQSGRDCRLRRPPHGPMRLGPAPSRTLHTRLFTRSSRRGFARM